MDDGVEKQKPCQCLTCECKKCSQCKVRIKKIVVSYVPYTCSGMFSFVMVWASSPFLALCQILALGLAMIGVGLSL